MAEAAARADGEALPDVWLVDFSPAEKEVNRAASPRHVDFQRPRQFGPVEPAPRISRPGKKPGTREAKMAPKRKRHGDGVGESPDEFAKPLDDAMEESSPEFAKPVYLVAAREAHDEAAYSVLKIDAAAFAGCTEINTPRIRTVAGLPVSGAEPGMSFVAAHSKHGSWIVGVGSGLRASTIIFDPRTLKTFQGPRLGYPKHEPILIHLTPPAELVVGTYAFHVVNKTWEKIHDKNLPFVGQAVPLGGSLFAACPMSNNSIAASASASVFHMYIKVPSATPAAAVSAPSFSVQELKVVASEDKIPWPLFFPPEKRRVLFRQVGVLSSPAEPQSLEAAPG
ncbi:hypothetical protein C2845_PM17G10720 [Panicum miliaceum]|uniref:Uncharacterized protein n=1 Tax=Panicum miliaceum TaxID=4540 RepID=A0A3L6Q791_PANMI|nr:hypothetical protein C2845_PM17G10720 [Panicum miliaceum]